MGCAATPRPPAGPWSPLRGPALSGLGSAKRSAYALGRLLQRQRSWRALAKRDGDTADASMAELVAGLSLVEAAPMCYHSSPCSDFRCHASGRKAPRPCDNVLALRAKLGNTHFHNVSRLQEPRWLHTQPHACGRTRCDDVSRLQGHDLTTVVH